MPHLRYICILWIATLLAHTGLAQNAAPPKAEPYVEEVTRPTPPKRTATPRTNPTTTQKAETTTIKEKPKTRAQIAAEKKKAAEEEKKKAAEEAEAALARKEELDLERQRDIKNRSDAARGASLTTKKNARTMSLAIPGPRGQITDRYGISFAQNDVAYQIALRMGQYDNETRENVLAQCKSTIASLKKIHTKLIDIDDDKLWLHYQHRRWLPLSLSTTLRKEEVESLRKRVASISGAELMPVYIRAYPQKTFGAHWIGYVGARGKMPTGPINYMDPIFQQAEGRSGLEATYNTVLTGKPGIWRLMFNEQGEKVLDQLDTSPKAGGTVVTTINSKWQSAAERALSRSSKRGAIVIIDCLTGEILAMASNPSFDLNQFIPYISTDDFDALNKHKSKPLFPRAYQGVYPPASTFKVMTILGGLRHKVIQENTVINCGAFFKIGNHAINDWSKRAAGPLNCISALARSNNVFMCKVAQRLTAERLLPVARAFGMGTRSGLVIADAPGLIPDIKYMQRVHRKSFFATGDAANMSIGQADLLASPLQVAHMMAGLGNGKVLPKLQIIKQLLDSDGNVIHNMVPEAENSLAEYSPYIPTILKGMRAVVNGGTGSRANLSFTTVCGKTGTAQWGPDKLNQRLAWFAGVLPYNNPRIAFAVLYEGSPGQRIGGGQIAAPIVRNFFEAVRGDVTAMINNTPLNVASDSTKKGAAAAAGEIPFRELDSPDSSIPSEKPQKRRPVRATTTNDSSD